MVGYFAGRGRPRMAVTAIVRDNTFDARIDPTVLGETSADWASPERRGPRQIRELCSDRRTLGPPETPWGLPGTGTSRRVRTRGE
jgi:hypothetical protein